MNNLLKSGINIRTIINDAIIENGKVQRAPNNLTSSTLISDYPDSKLSLMFITDGNTKGFPSQFGVIYTDKRSVVDGVTNDNYGFQEFKAITGGANTIYRRKALLGGWTAWATPMQMDTSGFLLEELKTDQNIEIHNEPDPNVNDDVVLPARMNDIRYARGNTFQYGSSVSSTARKLEIQFPSSFTETGFIRLGVDAGFWSITHYAEIEIFKGGITNTHNIDVISSQYSSRSQPMIGASIDNTGINITLTIQINSALSRPFFMMVKPLQQSPLGINRFREATYTVSEADAEYLAGTGTTI